MFNLQVEFDSPYAMTCVSQWLATERECRQVINATCDGQTLYRILDPDRNVIVETRFPVLMVAGPTPTDGGKRFTRWLDGAWGGWFSAPDER